MDKEDVVHIHNGILLSHKKERNNGICSNLDAMQLEIITLSEVCQKEKDKYHMTSLLCGISNMAQMNLSIDPETDSQM